MNRTPRNPRLPLAAALLLAAGPAFAQFSVRSVPVEGPRAVLPVFAPAAAPQSAPVSLSPALSLPGALPSLELPSVAPAAASARAAATARAAALADAAPAAVRAEAAASAARAAAPSASPALIASPESLTAPAARLPAALGAAAADRGAAADAPATPRARRLRAFILANAAALGAPRADDAFLAPAPAVNAAASAKEAPGAPLSESISKASPVEGFSSYVYDTALKAVLPLAEKAGYRPDNLRLTRARLAPRAFGEDWHFDFVSPREGYLKAPRRFAVSVRRTMVSETRLDAYDAKDLGETGLFTGYMAAEAPTAIKVDPMAAAAAGGAAARTLELLARWSEAGPAELVYVLRDGKGKELRSVNAATGEQRVPDPYAWVRGALVFLGMAALVVLIYGSIYWAVAHAPAAVGPWTPDVDWSTLFGR